MTHELSFIIPGHVAGTVCQRGASRMHGHVPAPPALVAPRGLAVLHGSYPPSQQHRAGEGEHNR